MGKRVTISDQLRRLIDESGMRQRAIARRVKMPESNLSRFMHGQAGISLDRIDAIAAVLGLELRRKEQ